MNTAVAFIFFNKTETTKQVFEQIKNAKPDKLYLISDGARESKIGESEIVSELRNWVENSIDWECKITKIYSDKNLGCKGRIVSGLTAVFENEEAAIIIEDDCKPRKPFFDYCEKMLNRYKDDNRVMMINGGNQVALSKYEITDDYCFSKNVWIWGWATWKRAWKMYDPDISDWPQKKHSDFLNEIMFTDGRINHTKKLFDSVYNNKIDTWDYQWNYCVWKNNGLAVTPKYNLVDNIGWGIPEALHTLGNTPKYLQEVFLDKRVFSGPIEFIDDVSRNTEFDKVYEKILSKESRKIILRIIRKVKSILHKFS